MSCKILVHLHLFYEEQTDYMISKLKNICDCEWDLFVTYVNCDKIYIDKILSFKNDAKFIKISNNGYDLIPFITLIKQIQLSQYDYVLKIHTKNKRKESRFKTSYIKAITKRYEWRNVLMDALLQSKKRFRKNISIISKANIGIIVSGAFRCNVRLRKMPEDTFYLEELKNNLGIKSNYPYFSAGSMFLIKAPILERLKNIKLNNDEIKTNNFSGDNSTKVHAIERIFTILTDDEGYKVCWIENPLYSIKLFYRYFKYKVSVKS